MCLPVSSFHFRLCDYSSIHPSSASLSIYPSPAGRYIVLLPRGKRKEKEKNETLRGGTVEVHGESEVGLQVLVVTLLLVVKRLKVPDVPDAPDMTANSEWVN